MRTVSFACPHCPGIEHCGAATIWRRCPCPITDRPVYFTEDWRPLAEPTEWHKRTEELRGRPTARLRHRNPPTRIDPEWVLSGLVTFGWMAALVLTCLAISR